ncbi:MaoC/PaaZ C-terminal domain-containing protein [Dactylosporangium sp. AC04546]|uniref:MaoC/PaaZ C-terminal domain-containing protein n=1 Tax=Dactylosporangium sp. AC04546 TaxID=2862460 RepID=UPI001EDF6450|nr:MaoC/PaaZ C-terminal domain-containing protein [Dactylosporangium sp. AC04546]WVK88234.1 MaoC/PaaZ C-terminal domain-containing protein [Dactylosporangium sp. AC04546]
MQTPVGPAARFFEDFTVDEEFVTQGRTVTQTDLTFWSMFTGDFNPIHVDSAFAREHSPFGTVVPQGLLAVAIASGLQERLGIFAGTGQAMLGQTITFAAAVVVGDTVRVRLTVRTLTPSRRPHTGRVAFDYAIEVVERGVTAVTGTLDVLCLRREPVSEPAADS